MTLALFNELDTLLTQWAAWLDWPLEALLRLALAMIAGGIIGLERELRSEHAGFRTMMLVCVGSALVMLISIRFAEVTWPMQPHEDNRVVVDPGRIAYGIMTGIGFLGAGTIIERRGRTSGLTTAAAIWCVAAIGMAIGFGLYLVAIVTTGVVIVALWLLNHLERFIPRRHRREVTLRTPYRPDVLSQTIERLRRPGMLVEAVAMEQSADGQSADVTLHLAYRLRRKDAASIEHELVNAGDYEILHIRAM